VCIALLVVAGLVAASPAGALPRTAKLRSQARALVAAGAPGVIILARDGDRTVKVAAGAGDLRPRRPMRATDRFRIGSVTKTFVATIVLQLVGEGRMTLDDTVDRWLPGLVPGGDTITVRQLLNHTSGLFDYLNDGDDSILAPYVDGDLGHVTTPQQIIAAATSHPPNFPPGAKFQYSNTGYIVLGLIAEAVTGAPLGDELQRRIAQPLGMRKTTLDASAARIAGPHAHAFLPTGPSGPILEIDELSSSLAWAAGAVVSSASDVATFYRALLQGRLLTPELLAAMETTVPIGPPGETYGLGLWSSRSMDLDPSYKLPCMDTAWGHDGDLAGWLSFAFNTPDARRQMVVLVNTDALGSRGRDVLGRIFASALCG
jgi:D-alanyl-D-alanine carboxypeptidase